MIKISLDHSANFCISTIRAEGAERGFLCQVITENFVENFMNLRQSFEEISKKCEKFYENFYRVIRIKIILFKGILAKY